MESYFAKVSNLKARYCTALSGNFVVWEELASEPL